MTVLIAHRGNFQGREKEKENSIQHILNAIRSGYDVEIDVWYVNGSWYFGHDFAEHLVDEKTILDIKDYAWYHAKNYEALSKLLSLNVHVFFHDQDEYTITSKGYVWAFSGKHVEANGVAVMPEYSPGFIPPENVYAICSDDLTVFQ